MDFTQNIMNNGGKWCNDDVRDHNCHCPPPRFLLAIDGFSKWNISRLLNNGGSS